MAQEEPRIEINGHVLTGGQATAVRVAVTNIHAETVGIGPLVEAYHARLGEVLAIMLREKSALQRGEVGGSHAST